MLSWKVLLIGAVVAGAFLLFFLFRSSNGDDTVDDDTLGESMFYEPGSLGYWPLDSPVNGPCIVDEKTDAWSDIAAVLNASIDFYESTHSGTRMVPLRYCRLGKLTCHIEFEIRPSMEVETHLFTFLDLDDALIVEKSEYRDDPYFRPGTLVLQTDA